MLGLPFLASRSGVTIWKMLWGGLGALTCWVPVMTDRRYNTTPSNERSNAVWSAWKEGDPSIPLRVPILEYWNPGILESLNPGCADWRPNDEFRGCNYRCSTEQAGRSSRSGNWGVDATPITSVRDRGNHCGGGYRIGGSADGP